MVDALLELDVPEETEPYFTGGEDEYYRYNPSASAKNRNE